MPNAPQPYANLSHSYNLMEKFDDAIPVSMKIWEELVTLPLYVGMTDEEVEIVINAVKSFKF